MVVREMSHYQNPLEKSERGIVNFSIILVIVEVGCTVIHFGCKVSTYLFSHEGK
jgi:hypothetical protein